MPFTVEVLVLKGAFPSSVAATFDVLATANRLRQHAGRPPAFSLRASGSGARQARALVGSYEGTEPADMIVVPGLGLGREDELAARLQKRDAVIASRALADAIGSGITVAGACSAVFLMAASGILTGRRATTTWWLSPLFRRLYPEVKLDPDALIVTDGPVTTAGAAMAQLDLSLAIVARHASPTLAEACARHLLLDERRSQSRYMALGFLTASDERVARAEHWVRGRLGKPFSVNDMAAAVGLSPRTFARRVARATGLSPIQFVQRLRIERAVEAVETSRLPFEEIARQVGYADASTLRRIMRRHMGRSARALRI